MKLSKKRAAEMQVYARRRKRYLANNEYCEAKANNLCSTLATQVHHKSGRVGRNLIDIGKFLAVCHNCHKWIEEHPKEAKERGFSLNRLT